MPPPPISVGGRGQAWGRGSLKGWPSFRTTEPCLLLNLTDMPLDLGSRLLEEVYPPPLPQRNYYQLPSIAISCYQLLSDYYQLMSEHYPITIPAVEARRRNGFLFFLLNHAGMSLNFCLADVNPDSQQNTRQFLSRSTRQFLSRSSSPLWMP